MQPKESATWIDRSFTVAHMEWHVPFPVPVQGVEYLILKIIGSAKRAATSTQKWWLQQCCVGSFL